MENQRLLSVEEQTENPNDTKLKREQTRDEILNHTQCRSMTS